MLSSFVSIQSDARPTYLHNTPLNYHISNESFSRIVCDISQTQEIEKILLYIQAMILDTHQLPDRHLFTPSCD